MQVLSKFNVNNLPVQLIVFIQNYSWQDGFEKLWNEKMINAICISSSGENDMGLKAFKWMDNNTAVGK